MRRQFRTGANLSFYERVEQWLIANVPPGEAPDRREIAVALGATPNQVQSAFAKLRARGRWQWYTRTRPEVQALGGAAMAAIWKGRKRTELESVVADLTDDDQEHDEDGVYLPTPEQIQATCARIRSYALGGRRIDTTGDRPGYVVDRWQRADPSRYARRA